MNWNLLFDGLMSAATVGLFVLATRKTKVEVQQPVNVELAEALASKEELLSLARGTRKEFDALWSTVRNENTAIRREITNSVQHSQEVVMEKLENNRTELSNKLDHIPDRVIATLKNTGAI